ncbi:MAG TPA: DUF4350 domain-containing protein [Burkholderiaceae bacterium]
MSGDSMRNLAIGLVSAAILGGMGWLLSTRFEPSWDPVGSNSEAAAKNPMLGAERLLQHRGYQVKVDQTLSIALFQPLPQGTLILSEGGDSMLATQSQTLLSWVARGNTLIVPEGWRRSLFGPAANKQNRNQKVSRDKAAAEATASIPEQFGVALGPAAAPGSVCRRLPTEGRTQQAMNEAAAKSHLTYADCVASVVLPGVPHPLRVDVSQARLINAVDKDANSQGDVQEPRQDHDSVADDGDGGDDADAEPDGKADGNSDSKSDTQTDMQGDKQGAQPVDQQANHQADASAAAPQGADDGASAVRIFDYGKGRVVILAERYFDNYSLPAYDHGELLLGLAALNAHGKNVILIEHVDIASWLSILWHAAPYAICVLAAFLLLWAWYSMRRFGPQLPEPDDRRRALLEHIDASGRWLWKSTRGRDIMLAAMRRVTERTLTRRIPELRKLAPERQVERLAADGKMSRAELERALLDAPGRLPIEFTRQIQTLQDLRAHYER